MQSIYAVLDELHIPYVKHDHPAVFTVDEAKEFDIRFPGGKSKNLFLRNKKADKYYLIVAETATRIDLKKVATLLGESRLSFASPERLFACLGVTPGSVSPFALINTKDSSVRVLIDQNLMKHTQVGFHPNINTSTLVIDSSDFKKFLTWTGRPVSYIAL